MNQHWRNAERGQSLVEMALGSVVLVMLLSGLLDLGRLYYIYITLEDAVGEAALYLSLDPRCITETSLRAIGTPCGETKNAWFRAQYAVDSNVSAVNWGNITQTIYVNNVPIDPAFPPLITVGDEVTVELEYPVGLLTPVIPQISGVNPFILRSRATQTIIRAYRYD